MNTVPQNLEELLVKLRALLPTLIPQYHINTLEIFGSFVRNEAHADSDLDLMVTFEQVPTLFQFVALENYLSDSLGIKVDLVMKDSLKPFIGQHILSEARPV
jgi:uncharacterized protein